jgi:NAD(P)-dependent dehydrogenase (short-subunit alcohol dehydrogenase family)
MDMSEMRYDDKVAVVTGAGQGLGRSHALFLASRGARVVVNDVGGATDGSGTSQTPAQKVCDEIRAAGGQAVPSYDSVSSEAGAQAVIGTAIDTFGRIDILVNNAGILRDKAFKNATEAEIRPVIDVHLYGTLWCTRAAWNHMLEQGYGRVVNTTSAAGLFGNFGQTNYGAAKMGIVGFSQAAAIEGARDNVKVNVIAPAARTRMTEELLGPMAEKLNPEQVTPVVGYLAHESCEPSGEIFSCGGGRVGRIFIGAVPGYFNPQLTAEGVREHLAEIRDTSSFVMPGNAMEEIGLLMEVSKDR